MLVPTFVPTFENFLWESHGKLSAMGYYLVSTYRYPVGNVANKTVNIYERVKVDGKWRDWPVAVPKLNPRHAQAVPVYTLGPRRHRTSKSAVSHRKG